MITSQEQRMIVTKLYEMLAPRINEIIQKKAEELPDLVRGIVYNEITKVELRRKVKDNLEEIFRHDLNINIQVKK